MKTYSAKIVDGVVVNKVVGLLDGFIPCPKSVGIGWSYDGVSFAPPPAPEPEPEPDIATARDLAYFVNGLNHMFAEKEAELGEESLVEGFSYDADGMARLMNSLQLMGVPIKVTVPDETPDEGA